MGVVGSEASKEDANREERTALSPAASSSLLCCCFFFKRQCPKGDRFLRSPETVVVVVVEEQLARCSRRPSKQGDGQGEESGVSLPRSGSESSDSLLWWKSRPSLLKPPFSMLSKAELRVTPRLGGLQTAFGKRLKDGRGGEALGLRGPSEDGWRGGGGGGGEKQCAS